MADVELIRRALKQADERISEWEKDFQGDLYAANTRKLLNLAIQEAEKLQRPRVALPSLRAEEQ